MAKKLYMNRFSIKNRITFMLAAIAVLCPYAVNAQQYGRPIADVSVGTWGPTTIHSVTSEEIADNAATAVYTSDPAAGETCEVQIGFLNDPGWHTGHTVRYKMNGNRNPCDVTPYLYQGNTLISTGPTESIPNASILYHLYEWTLSEAEALNITTYSDLHVRLVLGGVKGVISLTWIEVEVPSLVGGVDNTGGATSITVGSAILNGFYGPPGVSASDITIYWGDNDGGSNALSWDTPVSLGSRSVGPFSTTASSLTANKTYYYRCYGYDGGDIWADSTESFMTPAPSVQFNTASSLGSEGIAQVTLQVSLSVPSAASASVNYSLGSGTATSGSDFNFAPGTLNFAAGQTSTSITFTVTSDNKDEDDQTVIVTLSDASGAILGGNTSHTYAITDDDNPPTVSFAGAPYSISENLPNLNIDVQLSAESEKVVQVSYVTSNGTAVAGQDFTNTVGTLTWSVGQTGTKGFAVPIIDDSDLEGNQTFSVALYSPSQCTIAGTTPAGVTIFDDDQGPAFVDNGIGVTDITENSAQLHGRLTSTGGSPTSAWIYWGDNDGGSSTLAWDDNEPIGEHGIGTFSAAVSSLANNKTYYYRCYSLNGYGGAWADVTMNFITGPPDLEFDLTSSLAPEFITSRSIDVSISKPPVYGRTVGASYAVTGGDAINGTDYTLAAGMVIIPAGQTSATIPFTVINEMAFEYNETFTVTLSSPINCNIGTRSTHTYTIANDDTPPSVSFVNPPFFVFENGTNITIQVSLSDSSSATTKVNYVTSDGTAFNGPDYTAGSGQMVWNPGDTSTKSFTVPVFDDLLQLGSVYFNARLENPQGCSISGNAIEQVTIQEDDVEAPTITNGGGASNVQWTTATLNAFVSQVFPVPDVAIFWGPTDGGINTNAWQNRIGKGETSGFLPTDVDGLKAGTTYYYRAFAESWAGFKPADATASFTTKATTSISGTAYYVNDGSTNGDLYCLVAGTAGGTGLSPVSPKNSVQAILDTYDLNGGDCIFIDTGYYSIADQITIGSGDLGSVSNHVVLRGATGLTGSTIDRGGSSSSAQNVIYMSQSGNCYMRFESLRVTGGHSGILIEGNSGNDAYGIEVVGCASFNNFGTAGEGIYLISCPGAYVADNICSSNGWDGIRLDFSPDARVIGNTCFLQEDSTSYGMYVSASPRILISSNECYGHPRYGIYVNDLCPDSRLIDNVCYTNGREGLNVLGADSEVTGNVLYNNQRDGLNVAGADSEVTGNVLYNNQRDGLYAHAARLTIERNVMFANGGVGAYSDEKDQIFRNNTFYGNGYFGLHVAGADNRITIENNTISGPGGLYVNNPREVTIRNNILVADRLGFPAIMCAVTNPIPIVYNVDYNDLYAAGGAYVGIWGETICSTFDEWTNASGGDLTSRNVNPIFVDPGSSVDSDYHLQSRIGSYHNGAWTADAGQSPCIDAGDPWVAYDNEPDYNGLSLNQGAYGNTEEASKTEYVGSFYTVTAVPLPSYAGSVTVFPDPAPGGYPTNRLLRIDAALTNDNYEWTSWAGDLSGTETTQYFYVTGNMSIQGVFDASLYTITATADYGGNISPSGAVSVAAGTNFTFDIIPGIGSISNVVVDGVSKGIQASWTFTNVQATHTIDAHFDVPMWTIIATAFSGGTITPDGSVRVIDGGNQSFTIAPDGGYGISNVVVDGVSRDVVSNWDFLAVTNAHSIEAYFYATSSFTSRGTPHSWIDLYSLAVTNNYETADILDPDGDGMISWHEFIAGTIPNDGGSVLYVMQLNRAVGSRLHAQFPTVSGKNYRVQSATDCEANDWSDAQHSLTEGGGLQSTPIAGTDGNVDIYVETGDNTKAYRMRIQQ